METVDNRTFKQKIHDFWMNTKNKFLDIKDGVANTAKDHPMETFTLACMAVPGLLRLLNSVVRAQTQNKETRYNECDIYDPRTGTHYYTKRPLSNRQKLNLESEYKAGRNKGEILRDMGML